MVRLQRLTGMRPAEVPQALSMVLELRKGRSDAPERPPVLPVTDADIEAVLPCLLEADEECGAYAHWP